MNRQEFEHLRDLDGKVITADIVWAAPKDAKPNVVFDHVRVENTAGWDVILNGTFKPGIPSVTYNFVLQGVGPICRIDVNGMLHGDAGRTHKHDLRRDSDPKNNLPKAVARKDLEGKTAKDVWEDLCKFAKITHTGKFNEP